MALYVSLTAGRAVSLATGNKRHNSLFIYGGFVALAPYYDYMHTLHTLRRFTSRPLALYGLPLLVTDAAFFGFTNPNKLPTGLLIVGFILLGFTLYLALRSVIAGLALYGIRTGSHNRRLAVMISLAIIIMVALQSIGELTLRDVVVLLLLNVIIYGYISYGQTKTKNSWSNPTQGPVQAV